MNIIYFLAVLMSVQELTTDLGKSTLTVVRIDGSPTAICCAHQIGTRAGVVGETSESTVKVAEGHFAFDVDWAILDSDFKGGFETSNDSEPTSMIGFVEGVLTAAEIERQEMKIDGVEFVLFLPAPPAGMSGGAVLDSSGRVVGVVTVRIERMGSMFGGYQPIRNWIEKPRDVFGKSPNVIPSSPTDPIATRFTADQWAKYFQPEVVPIDREIVEPYFPDGDDEVDWNLFDQDKSE